MGGVRKGKDEVGGEGRVEEGLSECVSARASLARARALVCMCICVCVGGVNAGGDRQGGMGGHVHGSAQHLESVYISSTVRKILTCLNLNPRP